jgi:hypothetical protein
MVLANGVHTRRSIGMMMERTIATELNRLLQDGFLDEKPTSVAKTDLGHSTNSVRSTQSASVRVSVRSEAGVEKSATAATPAQLQPASRRSLAGTKMYIVDILQLLRNMDSSAMAVTLHTSRNEYEFIGNVIEAARFIANKNGVSYGLRVVNKLYEIVPEAHIPAVAALMHELEGSLAET